MNSITLFDTRKWSSLQPTLRPHAPLRYIHYVYSTRSGYNARNKKRIRGREIYLSMPVLLAKIQMSSYNLLEQNVVTPQYPALSAGFQVIFTVYLIGLVIRLFDRSLIVLDAPLFPANIQHQAYLQ